MKLTAVY